MRPSTAERRSPARGPLWPWWSGRSASQRSCALLGIVIAALLCLGCLVAAGIAGGRLWNNATGRVQEEGPTAWPSDSATLTVAVSPGMKDVFDGLVDDFNRQGRSTPDGNTMQVQTMELSPQEMVDKSLRMPDFQALAPDSSLWLNQLERRWSALQEEHEAADGEALIPLGNRRTGAVVRYAASPIVIAAWEEVARDLGWPAEAVGWEEIQRKATDDPAFKWNHPSTSHASGLLATLAEFYAGAGVTRGLTEEKATDAETLAYVQAVEATVRFYGESEDVLIEQLAAEGRGFLDAFVTQERVVVSWNATHGDQRLVAIYPAEGTLWADHPLALLTSGADEMPVTDNQGRVFHALAEFLTSRAVQKRLLEAGYRPADLEISLDQAGSPFAGSDAVDWRQPETTLQIPSASVVEVVQNVWWYTKRPTNVYLVVDTSGSMAGDKLSRTKEALQAFVSQIRGDRDRVGLIEFGTDLKSTDPLERLDDVRRLELAERIAGMEANGETALLDAVWYGHERIQQTADREAINALVVMTDGQENASGRGVSDLVWRLEQEGPVDIIVFTIAFGRGADEALLQRIADAGGGQFRRADETDIEDLYRVISTYF